MVPVPTDAPKLRGQTATYRPKLQPPFSVTLTQFGHDILRATVARTGLSRADVMEALLRQHAAGLSAEHVST